MNGDEMFEFDYFERKSCRKCGMAPQFITPSFIKRYLETLDVTLQYIGWKCPCGYEWVTRTLDYGEHDKSSTTKQES